ncbi:MAG: hypothetical protein RL448_20 [Actinomycetota bacterium]|jgi:predicted DsbA family dithiol-disulfide isomerase
MLIDVWSDVVCPWCFIGKRRLEKALAEIDKSIPIEIRHRAFQLDPRTTEIRNTKDLLAEKYGIPIEGVDQMQSHVCKIADGEGLCYDLSNTNSGNTATAHRLLAWARELGKGQELLEVLFTNYFEKSKGVFTETELLELVAEAGLSTETAKEIINSDRYAESLAEDQAIAQEIGIGGVPFFVFDQKYGISGAEDLDVFKETIAKTLEESK